MELVPQDVRWTWTRKNGEHASQKVNYISNLAKYLANQKCAECCLNLSAEAEAIDRLVSAAKTIDETPIPKPSTKAYERWVTACLELRAAIKEVEKWSTE